MIGDEQAEQIDREYLGGERKQRRELLRIRR
jgi:hypothetical protein